MSDNNLDKAFNVIHEEIKKRIPVRNPRPIKGREVKINQSYSKHGSKTMIIDMTQETVCGICGKPTKLITEHLPDGTKKSWHECTNIECRAKSAVMVTENPYLSEITSETTYTYEPKKKIVIDMVQEQDND